MATPLRIVHYVNQYFGGLGGEEKANLPVQVKEGAIGSARALQQALGGQATVVATIISGDNYLNEEKEQGLADVRRALEQYRPSAVVAGPAFDAGRYGLACAQVCIAAQEMGIPAVTSMHPENPGVIQFKKELIVIPTGTAITEMQGAVSEMARLALKLGRGEELGPAEVEGYLPRGIRKPGLRDKPAHQRAVEMLIAKVNGQPFRTELPIEMPELVQPAAPVADLSKTRLALITCGGLVPKGNPDKMPGGPSHVWYKYSIAGLSTMSPDMWESVHVGFYTNIVNQNPNYVLPLNLVRELEDRGVIGEIYPWYLTTSGRGTPVGVSRRMGQEMAQDLKEGDVGAALLVAT